MAEAIMNGELIKRGVTDAHAESCGVMAFSLSPANEYAKNAVMQYGVSLEAHSARRISADILKGAIVLCMEKSISDYVKALFPGEAVFDLCSYASVPGRISDPYGMDQDTYDACAEKIRMCIVKILQKEEESK